MFPSRCPPPQPISAPASIAWGCLWACGIASTCARPRKMNLRQSVKGKPNSRAKRLHWLIAPPAPLGTNWGWNRVGSPSRCATPFLLRAGWVRVVRPSWEACSRLASGRVFIAGSLYQAQGCSIWPRASKVIPTTWRPRFSADSRFARRAKMVAPSPHRLLRPSRHDSSSGFRLANFPQSTPAPHCLRPIFAPTACSTCRAPLCLWRLGQRAISRLWANRYATAFIKITARRLFRAGSKWAKPRATRALWERLYRAPGRRFCSGSGPKATRPRLLVASKKRHGRTN